MIYGIYFSPTNNSRKYVEAMARSLHDEVRFIDVTTNVKEHTFTENDFVIIGAPVYAGRIPNVCKQRFLSFKGNNTPCIVVVTYGNRHYDDALVEMQDVFENKGFIVHGACALIGRHTYGSIQVDRPNQTDLQEAVAFALQVKENNHSLTQSLPGQHHTDEIVNKGRFHPMTNNLCLKCQICVQNCPVQAIDHDCISISNDCISCFRCIRNCPVNAKHMEDDDYNNFAKMFSEKLKERRENEFFM